MSDPAQLQAEWLAAMRRGDFAAAWAVSDQVLREGLAARGHSVPRHLRAVWDGTPLARRRVRVQCFHGLGDTLQFARYLPLLRELADEVTLHAQPELLPLLRRSGGMGRVLPLPPGDGDADEDAVEVELMELPWILRSTLATLPRRVPYLHAPRAPLAREGYLEVGVVWAAGDWDARRSLDPALLLPLARLPGVRLHLLQRGPPLARRPEGLGVDAGCDDVLGAAALMRALDLVISVDSMPAHLAGALGVPVWTLLHAEPDWRWMDARTDSPWYPTMRLFRQQLPGEWEPVVAAVTEALGRAAAGLSRRSYRRPQALAMR